MKYRVLVSTLTIILAGWPFVLVHKETPAKPKAAPIAVTESDQPVHRLIMPRATRHRRVAPKRRKTVTHRSQTLTAGGVWARLRQCESGSDGLYLANTGNGFYGAYQFTKSSWRAVGGTGSPQNASSSEQDMRAKKLKDLQGWGAWPACSRKLGLQ